ncbi:hypothetical protein V6N13_070497 [Hibiscus sabdariffa]|uniref:FLZ-type domain-containing protein n=1 Tax=Hibiscus sabdariffa TaxID=183260 RepID=A0ABR2TG98_9ROSI
MEAGFSGSSHCQNHKHQTGFLSRFLCFTRNSSAPQNPSSSTCCDSRFEDRRPHFLNACFLCKKPLGGNKDIFIGDTPFCSEECRCKQIEMDEVNEKRLRLSATLKALHTGTVVAV